MTKASNQPIMKLKVILVLKQILIVIRIRKNEFLCIKIIYKNYSNYHYDYHYIIKILKLYLLFKTLSVAFSKSTVNFSGI